MKRPRPQVVEVEWEDSAVNSQTWDLDEEPLDTLVLYTVGFLVERSKRKIVIAAEWAEKQGTYRYTHAIPTRVVRRVRWLKA